MRGAAGGMIQRGRADKLIGQLGGGTTSASVAGGARRGSALEPEQHPECKLCDHLKAQIQKDKKNFFLESEHVRGAVGKCLDLLASHLRGSAFDDFQQSLQLDVRYISEHKEVSGQDDERRGRDESHASGGGDQSAEIAKLRKKLQRAEDQIDELEAENLRLKEQLKSQASGPKPTTKRFKVAEKEVQTDPTQASTPPQPRTFGSFAVESPGPERHTITPQSMSSPSHIPSAKPSPMGDVPKVISSNKNPEPIVATNSASPSPSNRSTASGSVLKSSDSSALMANIAKSAGITEMVSSPPGKKSLWGGALFAIKEKKKSDEKALLEKLKQELAEAQERAKQLEAENKDILGKLRSTEDELKAKSKELAKLETKVKLMELKAKRKQQTQPTSVASTSAPTPPPASRSEQKRVLKEAGNEQSVAGSDDEKFENQPSAEPEDLPDNSAPIRPPPVRDGTGCKALSRVATPAIATGSTKPINKLGKVYDKRTSSAPHLASLGKAVPKTAVPFECNDDWMEPYLGSLWSHPKTGGPFIRVPYLPFATMWDLGADGATQPVKDAGLVRKPQAETEERRPASSAARLTPLDLTITSDKQASLGGAA